MPGVLLILLILMAGFFLAPTVIKAPVAIVAVGVGSFFLFLLLTNFEFGLMLILFVIPFSVQANLGSVAAGMPIDIGIDDFFIFCLFVTWLVYLGKTRQSPFVSTPFTWPFMAYLVACILSFLPMMASGKGSIGLSTLHLIKWYEYVFIYFVMARSLEHRSQIIHFTILAIISAALVGILHFGQLLLGIARGGSVYELIMTANAGFQSNGILGAYYVFFLMIVASFLAKMRRSMLRLGLFALGGLLSFNLFYTYARAAYLGFVVGFIFLGFLHHKRLMFFSLLMLALLPAVLNKSISERITYTIKVDPSQLNSLGYRMPASGHGLHLYHKPIELKLDASSMERIINWKKVKKIIYENFLLGTGYWSGRFLGLFGMSTSHNFYLTVFMETGVLGLLAFLWLSFTLIIVSIQLAHNSTDFVYDALGKGFAAGYLGILVHCFFGETFEDFRITGPVWMMAGIVAAAKHIQDEQRKAALAVANEPQNVRTKFSFT